MAESVAFSFVCEQLEQRTSLDRLEARGTVRIALKQAGLEAGSVVPDQMEVVLERLMPGELASRAVEGAESLCAELIRAVAGLSVETAADSPESVFARLGVS
jgi:hypothetical protein